MDIDLSVELSGVRFKNPLIISGGVPSWNILIKAIEQDVGGVVFGSIGLRPLSSHPPPFIIRLPYGFVNAYGVRHGLSSVEEELLRIIDLAERFDSRVICSCVEERVEDMMELAHRLEGLGCSIIELNLSAPVIREVLEKGLNIEVLEKITRGVSQEIHVPLSVKLSPLILDPASFTRRLYKSGARIIHLSNALSPALVLDIKTGKPVLKTSNGLGALSGPAIKPVALAKVYLAAKENPSIPIIGTGGVSVWKDLVEMILAGAWAVGIHSTIYIHGIKIIRGLLKGLTKYLVEKGYSNVNQIRGLSYKND